MERGTGTGAAWSRPDAGKLIAVFASPGLLQPASPATTLVNEMPRATNAPEMPRKSAGVATGGVRETKPQPASATARRQDTAIAGRRSGMPGEASTGPRNATDAVLGSSSWPAQTGRPSAA